MLVLEDCFNLPRILSNMPLYLRAFACPLNVYAMIYEDIVQQVNYLREPEGMFLKGVYKEHTPK